MEILKDHDNLKKFPTGGSILIPACVDVNTNDFIDLYSICEFFAKAGNNSIILPQVHFKDPKYQEFYGKLNGTIYEGKCPDLRINDLYYEYESYTNEFNKRKISNMISRGLKQSSRVIINNTEKSSDHYISKVAYNRIRDHKIVIDELWVKNTKKLDEYYKRRNPYLKHFYYN